MDYIYGGNGMNNMYGQQPQPVGYGYNGYTKPIKRQNILPKETVNSLRSNVTNFTLGLTKEEVDRAACNHYYDGELMLRPVAEEPGVYQCSICGYRFVPKEGLTLEQLNDAVEGIIDILQTIKLMYVDAPEKAMIDYMSVIALLKKAPQLYRLAADNQAKYDGTLGTNQYNGNLNAFNILSNVLNGSMMNMGAMAQPQPMMNQPTAAQGAMLAANDGSYMPSTTGYAYSPGTAASPTSNLAAENEKLRHELEELRKQQLTTNNGSDQVTAVAKMES